jgi:hypothetical protein
VGRDFLGGFGVLLSQCADGLALGLIRALRLARWRLPRSSRPKYGFNLPFEGFSFIF